MAHRIFKPVILFHDHSFSSESNGVTHRIHIPYGDPHYTPLIQRRKQKVGMMLKNNGQAWHDIIQSSKHHHHAPPTSPIPTNQNKGPPRIKQKHQRRNNNQSLLERYSQHLNHHLGEEEDDQDMTSDTSSITSSSESSSCTTTQQHHSPKPSTTSVRKRRGNLPKNVTAVLKQWLVDHCFNPYPTEIEKTSLKDKTGLTLNQISNWFINARRRLLPQILQENSAASHDLLHLKKRKRSKYQDDEPENDELISNQEPNTPVVRRKRHYNKKNLS